MVCTFFGHSFAGSEIRPYLTECLQDLIENKNATEFLVGNHGNFDAMVWEILNLLKAVYPHIVCYKVLAYLPTRSEDGGENTLFPEGLETVPRKFAIIKRNEWMINKADTVITYVKHTTGGAYRFSQIAKKKGKQIIEL